MQKLNPPINPSILFFGETVLKRGLFPNVTPNTYAAESEIQIRDKKENTMYGLYSPKIFGREKNITREPTK